MGVLLVIGNGLAATVRSPKKASGRNLTTIAIAEEEEEEEDHNQFSRRARSSSDDIELMICKGRVRRDPGRHSERRARGRKGR